MKDLFYVTQTGNFYQARLKEIYPHHCVVTSDSFDSLMEKLKVFIKRYKTERNLISKLRNRNDPIHIPTAELERLELEMPYYIQIFGDRVEEALKEIPREEGEVDKRVRSNMEMVKRNREKRMEINSNTKTDSDIKNPRVGVGRKFIFKRIRERENR